MYYPSTELWDSFLSLDPEAERKMERQRKAREKALNEMKERHATYVRGLQDKAFERIRTIEAKELTAGDALVTRLAVL